MTSLLAYAGIGILILAACGIFAVIVWLIRMDLGDERHDHQTALSLVAHDQSDDAVNAEVDRIKADGDRGNLGSVEKGCFDAWVDGNKFRTCLDCAAVLTQWEASRG